LACAYGPKIIFNQAFIYQIKNLDQIIQSRKKVIKQFQCKNPLELLGKEDIKAIHFRTLRILHEIGAIIEDEEVLSLLADHGCIVDMKQKRVWMEPDLVEKALKSCPSGFTLKSRDGANDLLFDRDTVRFGPCSGMQVVDIATGRLRPGTVADAQKTLKLTDTLDIMAGANAGLGFLSDRPTGHWFSSIGSKKYQFILYILNTEKSFQIKTSFHYP